MSSLQKLNPVACVQMVGDMPSAEAFKVLSCHMQSCSLRCAVHKQSQEASTACALHAIAELRLDGIECWSGVKYCKHSVEWN